MNQPVLLKGYEFGKNEFVVTVSRGERPFDE
jgi:hypothetical protein